MASGADKIPITVIIATREEERRIGRCLAALSDFAEVIVVDSESRDRTKELAQVAGAKVVDFAWNGQYPKKRQWCLDNLQMAHDWAFFVDADEIITPELVAEIRKLDFRCAGYFVQGRYIFAGKMLRFGLRNNKLALIDRRRMEFPVVNDLGAPGMGEIEGHYQPVLKGSAKNAAIGRLKGFLLHDAYDDPAAWMARHERYAAWERDMDRRRAWPEESSIKRRWLKRIFKALPCRPAVAFLHCYVLNGGFLDGAAGFNFARSRYAYYRLISSPSKAAARAA